MAALWKKYARNIGRERKMSEDDGMREDVLEPGELRADSMEIYELIQQMPPDIRGWIIRVGMVYVERVLAEESSDDPTLE